MPQHTMYDDKGMAEFIRRPAMPCMFNGYGHNLLEMGTDTLNSTFSASVMNVLDQDYLKTIQESAAIQDTLSTNVMVYDVFEETMKAMEEDGNRSPIPSWIENDAVFQQEMVKRAKGDFEDIFSREKKLNPESKAMFIECLKEFGPKSFGMLNEKLGALQNRKGELNGIIQEIQDAFEDNFRGIHQRWGLHAPDEIMAVGMAEGLPAGFDPRDSVQLGKMIVEALRNPELSKIDLLGSTGAAEFRDKYVRDIAAANTANMANPQLGGVQRPGVQQSLIDSIQSVRPKSNSPDGEDDGNPYGKSKNNSRPAGMGMY